jgi:hypothetical protein
MFSWLLGGRDEAGDRLREILGALGPGRPVPGVADPYSGAALRGPLPRGAAGFQELQGRLLTGYEDANRSVSYAKRDGLDRSHPTRWRDEVYLDLWWIAGRCVEGLGETYASDLAAYLDEVGDRYRRLVEERVAPSVTGPVDRKTEEVFEFVVHVYQVLVEVAPEAP